MRQILPQEGDNPAFHNLFRNMLFPAFARIMDRIPFEKTFQRPFLSMSFKPREKPKVPPFAMGRSQDLLLGGTALHPSPKDNINEATSATGQSDPGRLDSGIQKVTLMSWTLFPVFHNHTRPQGRTHDKKIFDKVSPPPLPHLPS